MVADVYFTITAQFVWNVKSQFGNYGKSYLCNHHLFVTKHQCLVNNEPETINPRVYTIQSQNNEIQ